MVLFENIFFLLCRKNHTLAATWSITAEGDKTISSCVVGEPVILCHGAGSASTNASGCFIRIKSGANSGLAANWYGMGLHGQGNAFSEVFVIIPTATSVVCNFTMSDTGSNNKIYVYK